VCECLSSHKEQAYRRPQNEALCKVLSKSALLYKMRSAKMQSDGDTTPPQGHVALCYRNRVIS
jgi:hypothetical protein